MSRWFRFYDAAIDDPKVQRLPDALFKTWVNLLCLASQGAGVLPPIADIAFRLRLSEKEAGARLASLKSAGLLDDGTDGAEPHNWRERQKASDSSAERVKRHRERQAKQAEVVACNVTETVQRREEVDVETDKSSLSTHARAIADFRTAIVLAYQAAGSATIPDTSIAAVWIERGYNQTICLAKIEEIVRRKPTVGLAYCEPAIVDAHTAPQARAGPLAPSPAPQRKSATTIAAELNAKSHERHHDDRAVLDLTAAIA